MRRVWVTAHGGPMTKSHCSQPFTVADKTMATTTFDVGRFVGVDGERLEEYKCPSCLLVPTLPYVTHNPSPANRNGCGHITCEPCIRSWLAHEQSCPTCRAPVQSMKEILADVRASREITQWKVTCSGKEFGCAWEGVIGPDARDLLKHEQECEHVIPRRVVVAHAMIVEDEPVFQAAAAAPRALERPIMVAVAAARDERMLMSSDSVSSLSDDDEEEEEADDEGDGQCGDWNGLEWSSEASYKDGDLVRSGGWIWSPARSHVAPSSFPPARENEDWHLVGEGPLIARQLPFQRLVLDISDDLMNDSRWTSSAIKVLQHAAELYLTQRQFRNAPARMRHEQEM